MNAVDHLTDQAKLARMEEFISSRKLDVEFLRYVEGVVKAREDVSKPCVDFVYNLEGRRSSSQELANITPWLRTASLEDVLRLVSFGNCDDVEDEKDTSFMFDIVEGCVDEEDKQKMWRYSEVTFLYNYFFHENLRKHLEAIRPDDHAAISAVMDEVAQREEAE